MTLRFFEEAETELIEAIRWYARDDVAVAADLARAVKERVAQAAALQGAGRLETRAPERFELRWYGVERFPYSILVGTVSGERVVVAVAHERRRPSYWIDRLR